MDILDACDANFYPNTNFVLEMLATTNWQFLQQQ